MKQRQLVVTALLALAFAFPGVRPATAQSGARWTDPELTALSDFILTGRVAGVEPGWDYATETIYTYVTVEIDQVLKGWIPEPRIVLKQLGGQVGEIGLAIGGQAIFEPGEETLLFLETRPRDGSLCTAALWEGKWSIARDESQGPEFALRSEARMDRSQGVRPFGENADTRMLRPFLAEIRRWAGEYSRRPSVGERLFQLTEAPLPDGAGKSEAEISGLPEYRVVGEYSFMGGRWMEADLGLAIPVLVHKRGEKGVSGKGFEQAVAAAAVWSHPRSSLRLDTSPKAKFVRKKGCTSRLRRDGRILVVFRDPCHEMADGGATLATGGYWFNCTNHKVVRGASFCKIISGFLVTNSDSEGLRETLWNDTCFQEIVTHELGHTIGLGHSSKKRSMMFGELNASCMTAASPRRLRTDDKKGVKAIYPR